MLCRKCNSSKVILSKKIGWGKAMGNVYHYKLSCLNCKTSCHIERTKEIYEILKDKEWEYSKSYIKHNIDNITTKML